MRKKFIVILMLIIISIDIHIAISTNAIDKHGNGLTIATTFPYLYKDLSYVLCPNDSIIYLLRPGEDPHEHMLTPYDIERLREADIIISTSHTHFEQKIKELIANGELKAKLIEIPYIPNITILINPATDQPNYHGLIFYPYNYIVFLKYLRSILISASPLCRDVYNSRIYILINEIENISMNIPRIDIDIGILDTPLLQYVAYWLGIKRIYIIKKEHEVPITPDDIKMARRILEKNNSIIFVANNSPAYSLLIDMSKNYNRPILVLPDIENTFSIIDTLKDIVIRVKMLNQSAATSSIQYHSIDVNILLYSIPLLSISIVVILLYKRLMRR